MKCSTKGDDNDKATMTPLTAGVDVYNKYVTSATGDEFPLTKKEKLM